MHYINPRFTYLITYLCEVFLMGHTTQTGVMAVSTVITVSSQTLST